VSVSVAAVVRAARVLSSSQGKRPGAGSGADGGGRRLGGVRTRPVAGCCFL